MHGAQYAQGGRDLPDLVVTWIDIANSGNDVFARRPNEACKARRLRDAVTSLVK